MYILADIGGSKMRIAGTRDLKRFGEPITVETPQDHTEGVDALARIALNLAQGETIEGTAIGLTGVIVRDTGSVYASSTPDWNGHPIAEAVEEALGAPVYLENDTALVGLGEAHFGAGQGASILAYITVSTGVNGVRIVDGIVDEAALGFEIGQQYLSMQGATLEMLVSGKAIQKKYGKPPRDIGKDSPLWDELALVLAYGLNNTIVHWSPHRIVLGGSMFNTIGIPVEAVKAHLESILHKYPELPELVHSRLGDFGGLWGGMALLEHLRSE